MLRVIIISTVLVFVAGCSQPVIRDVVEITETNVQESEQNLDLNSLDAMDAPFIVQAPFADWDDPRQQDACEEASVIMAVKWSQGVTKISKSDALELILEIVTYEEEIYGSNKDTSIQDTFERIVKGYFDFENASLVAVNSAQDLKDILQENVVVIMPANGKALNNPNFSGDGPDKHMLILKRYDADKDQFISNDPGTRNGENYPYSSKTIMNALQNYKTTGAEGEPEPNAVIVVRSSF